MYKVLVVDDVSGLRQHMTAVLNERVTQNVEITEAVNGEEGLKIFRTLGTAQELLPSSCRSFAHEQVLTP
jgi:CheY-like chemotaxis protein